MKKLFITFISALISISAISQDFQYRKDDRPQNVKDDRSGIYQDMSISEIDIIKALEMAGIRIFIVPIVPAFDKEYMLTVHLSEYVNGEKTNSRSIDQNKNIYRYLMIDPITQERARYFDYVPKLTIFTKDNDTSMSLTLENYVSSTSGIRLTKNKVRESQFYVWRPFSKTDWELNKEVPLMVYSSSWYDEKNNIERNCAVRDLSLSEDATKELFDSSPHYFIISFKVSE